MTKQDDKRRRVADYFRHAEEIHGSARAAALEFGTNNHTWAKLVAGDIDSLRSDARRAVLKARGWPPTAFLAIAEGRDPDDEPASLHQVVDLQRRMDEMELRLLRLEGVRSEKAEP